jgi:sugar lactone lactonase YvrE
MNGKYITAFLLFLVLVIAAIFVFDRKTERSDISSYLTSNPMEKDLSPYMQVPDSLISHREAKQIQLKAEQPKAIEYADGCLYMLLDDYLQVIRTNGWQVAKVPLGDGATSLKVLKDKRLIIGFNNFVALFNPQYQLMERSEPEDSAHFTAVATDGKSIFVADAGRKEVHVLDFTLKQKSVFRGESGITEQHGFIVPSMHFDLAVNDDQELWVVNPGMHALQNYSNLGKLRGYWSKPSFEIEGFSGCCNPFRIAFQPDGSLVTSEKGLVRIKIHEASGALRSVVAPPSAFEGEKKAPDVAVDRKGVVYALDFERKSVRIFEPKKKP